MFAESANRPRHRRLCATTSRAVGAPPPTPPCDCRPPARVRAPPAAAHRHRPGAAPPRPPAGVAPGVMYGTALAAPAARNAAPRPRRRVAQAELRGSGRPPRWHRHAHPSDGHPGVGHGTHPGARAPACGRNPAQLPRGCAAQTDLRRGGRPPWRLRHATPGVIPGTPLSTSAPATPRRCRGGRAAQAGLRDSARTPARPP